MKYNMKSNALLISFCKTKNEFLSNSFLQRKKHSFEENSCEEGAALYIFLFYIWPISTVNDRGLLHWNKTIELYFFTPNVPKSVIQIFYLLRLISSILTLHVKYINGFQLTKRKEIPVAFCNSQRNKNLLIIKTISSYYWQKI